MSDDDDFEVLPIGNDWAFSPRESPGSRADGAAGTNNPET